MNDVLYTQYQSMPILEKGDGFIVRLIRQQISHIEVNEWTLISLSLVYTNWYGGGPGATYWYIGQCRIYIQRISSIDTEQGDFSSVGALNAVQLDSYLLTIHPL